MIETTKAPVNTYNYNGSMDHGYESGTSDNNSRRNSFALKDVIRGRRFTMLSRLPKPSPTHSVAENSRKVSCQVSSMTARPDFDDDDMPPMPLYRRRMSVPENVFQRADYAILRPTRDPKSQFEVVAAFDRYTDPYRHYMQSISCYELQPTHGSVVIFDGGIKVKQALTALGHQGHQAAVVWNADLSGKVGIITITDCLNAIMMATRGMRTVAEMTLNEFLKETGAKPLILTCANTSVWDAAKVLCLNRVRSLPVFDSVIPEPNTVLFFLTLKSVLHETVLKLTDSSASLSPHIKQTTLYMKKVGTWEDITTLPTKATCKDAIEIFLKKKLSSVPIVADNGHLIGIVSKHDIMRELIAHSSNYLNALTVPITDVVAPNPVIGKPDMTVIEAIHTLVNTDKQCLIVVNQNMVPVAVVSYSDLMDYIQKAEGSHKNSTVA